MGALIGRKAALRWVHLVLGGALLMPYWLLSLALLSTLDPGGTPKRAVLHQLLALPAALPIAALSALVPVVRVLESTAARALCAGAGTDLVTTASRSWEARRRTAVWYVLHLLLGGIVAGMSLSVPFAAVALVFFPDPTWSHFWFGPGAPAGWLIALGLALLVVVANAAAGAVLARAARPLLGPTPGERLAAAEQRALELAQRNRLARELHDSVGHALSAVTLQAAAAGRVLDRDPAFAAEALRAIEETARTAVGELDAVLGLLHEDDRAEEDRGEGDRARENRTEGDRAEAGPTLGRLDVLLRQMALAGVEVGMEVDAGRGPGLAGIPEQLSREAYRIVQEGLTNVLRHAGAVAATLRLDLGKGFLAVELTNPIIAGRPSRPGGGRGLRGMAERATALRGAYRAGPTEDGRSWQLAVRLPLAAATAGGGR